MIQHRLRQRRPDPLYLLRDPLAQSRYCSVKGCRTLIGGDYLFKMCVPCRNRYRGYGMTKRSKWKRGREIAAQELERIRVEEDARRARQGLPVSSVQPPTYPIDTPLQLISQLQASDRRAWERKVSETIPRPPVVQYTPISMLPVRMCTVSHCHTVLQGHYPYRRCERHRLQNRHHSKLKRVRDKEVKSTPLRREGTLNPGPLGNGSRKGKARAIEPLYTNEPLNLDLHDLETEEAVSEVRFDFSFLLRRLSNIVVIRPRKCQTKAQYLLPLAELVVQIQSVPSSGVITC
jgi:hypothetical protein